MTNAPDNRGRGFGRLVEAGKGVAKFFNWLADADIEAEKEEAERKQLVAAARERAAKRCDRPQTEGWECVVEGEHGECVVERITRP